MNRLDIRITTIQTVQNFAEFQSLKAELLLRQSSSSVVYLGWSEGQESLCVWFIRKNMVGTEQGS